MESIASGYKINVAADGPADLIQSEKLRSQIDGLERAMQNTSETNNILGIMEGALGQVQSIISRMSGLAIEAANTGVVSPDRIAANQAEIDAGLQAIERIYETTSYGGRKILNNMQDRGLIDKDYSAIANAGKLLQENGGRIPEKDLHSLGEPGKFYYIDRDQNHPDSLTKDGKTLAGDKTFVLPPAEEGGDPTELVFEKGTSLSDMVAALKKHGEALPPQEGESFIKVEDADGGARYFEKDSFIKMEDADGVVGYAGKEDGVFADRSGADIDRVELSGAHLASLAEMTDEDAAASLANYMDDFTREMEIDLSGWNSLSDADKSLLLTADKMAHTGLGDIASIQDALGNNLTLRDLYSSGKASLARDPAKAIELLDKARRSVTADRAMIGVTQKMNQHSMNADAAAMEATQRMESYLRDTEIAEATTEMARTEILQQTGMAVLKKSMEQHKNSILNLIA
jgi:flagellin